MKDIEPQVSELMAKLDKVMPGYQRIVIIMACSRTIAAMLGPAAKETREKYLKAFPVSMRAIWRKMDKIVQ